MPPPADPSAAAVPHAPTGTLCDLMAEVLALKAMLATMADPPELLDLAAVLAMTSQSRSSWYRAVSAGEAPAGVDTPSGKRWRRKDVVRWIERLK